MIEKSETALSRRTLFLYAIPTAGMNGMYWLIMVFLLKFATDTLGIEPVMVGAIFAIGRLWDAISDPIAGWASDRTQLELGRRRPWMLGAALPTGIAFYALWNVPEGASPSEVTLWLGVSLLIFFTSMTAVKIPYLALGAELTEEHHERTRISAARVGAEAVGIFGAVAGLYLIENADSIRETASHVAAVLSVITVVTIVYASSKLREPLGNRGRASTDPYRAMLDVMKNPHALRLTLGILLSELGLGSLLTAIPFVTEEMGQPGTSAIRILGFVIPFVLSVPLWIRLGKRFGKSRCYAAGSAMAALAFVAIGIIGFSSPILATLAMLAIGVSQAALRTFPDSIKADVIDWDEAATGERKEGSYIAAWNLADKAAGVVSVALVGFFIQAKGGGVDSDGVRFVVSYMPAFFMTLSMLVVSGFRLGATEHAELRKQIASSPA